LHRSGHDGATARHANTVPIDDYLRFPVNGAQGRLRKYGNEEFKSSASDMNVKRPAAMPAGLFVV
jgi:hypothetical protein